MRIRYLDLAYSSYDDYSLNDVERFGSLNFNRVSEIKHDAFLRTMSICFSSSVVMFELFKFSRPSRPVTFECHSSNFP